MRCPLSRPEIRARLETAARKGKLPGWRPAEGPAGESEEEFAITDFAVPFEHVLVARAETGTDGTTLRFALRVKPTMPLVYLVVLVATVWPGVWLTDSMLRSYFTGYDWRTWMWYLPLTVPFVPLALASAWKKSRRSAAAEAAHLIAKVAGLIDGRTESGGPGTPPGP
ncbi:MAG: hypothetical protein ACK4WH_08575 [Phycisphaerales bacterium]